MLSLSLSFFSILSRTIFLPFLSLLLPFFLPRSDLLPCRRSLSLLRDRAVLFHLPRASFFLHSFLTRSPVYIALRPHRFPLPFPTFLTRVASTVLPLCHALTSFSSVFQLSLFRPLHLSASPAATSSSDLLSDRSTSGTVLLSRCFLFPVNKGSEGAGIRPGV